MRILLLLIIPLIFPFISLAGDGDKTYNRVMKSGTLRCGYTIWPDALEADAEGKPVSGYYLDIMRKVGGELGVSVQWVHETAWEKVGDELRDGTIDMHCGHVCVDAVTKKHLWWSLPFVHVPDYVFVKVSNDRFSEISDLNNKSVTIAVIKNSAMDNAAKFYFRKARILYVKDLNELYEAVAEGRADASFAALHVIEKLMEIHDGAIRHLEKPVRYCKGGFLYPLEGDGLLKRKVDTIIQNLIASGEAADIVSITLPEDGRYWIPPVSPYRE